MLDGMHEGLLILSKEDKQVMFSNRPSCKLLIGALSISNDHVNEPEFQRLLNSNIFNPIKMMEKDSNLEESKLPISLEMIITSQIDEPAQKLCIYEVSVK